MKRLSLSPEHLRVESFPTGVVPSAGGALVVSTWPIRTRPECANTVYDTCDC
jgi:hypothetical protein